jgi:light-regulated signal transduction histidine kinase (bacteriophytochrome)
LQEANQELEAFAYSVSHDLRAPLRHIDAFAGLLKEDTGPVLTDQGRHYLEHITASAKQMRRLIDDLLSLSRSGRAQMTSQPLSLQSLVAEAITELQPETVGRNIHWKTHPLPDARADRDLLRQVFINLLANAIKYTRPRDPAVIEIGCAGQSLAETVFFVRDNGVGFEMQFASKLFGVFQRLHPAEEFEGTGIGLANVRRIIARHGGRTWAEGKPNAGATFYFSLPHQTEAATSEASASVLAGATNPGQTFFG